MRKKLVMAAISTALVIGAPTAAFAGGNSNGNGCRNRCGGSTSTTTIKCYDSSGNLVTVNALNCISVGLFDVL